MRLTHRLALLASAAALALACGSREQASTPIYSSLAPHATQLDPLPFDWPPERATEYPNLVLRDHRGEWVELESFRGKVLLIEPVGMT